MNPNDAAGQKFVGSIRFKAIAVAMLGLGLGRESFAAATVVGLDQILAALPAEHPVATLSDLAVEFSAAAVDASRGADDWLLTGQTGYRFLQPIGPDGVTVDFSHAAETQFGLARKIRNTGGALQFGGSYVVSVWEPPVGVPAQLPLTLHQPGLSIGFSQPLLRNRGGTLDLNPTKIAEGNSKAAQQRSDEAIETLALEVARIYVGWASAVAQAEIATERVALAASLYEKIQQRQRANFVDIVDLERADALRIDAQAGRIQAHGAAEEYRNALAEMLAAPNLHRDVPDTSIFVDVTRPLLPHRPQPDSPALREIAVFAARREVALANRAAARDATKSDLSLLAGYSLYGENGDDSPAAVVLDRNRANLGLRFELPIRKTGANADLRRAELALASIEAEELAYRRSVGSQAAALLAQGDRLKQFLEMNEAAGQAAERIRALEQNRYNQGRGRIDLVVESLDHSLAVKLQRIEIAAAIRVVELQLLALYDVLYAAETPR